MNRLQHRVRVFARRAWWAALLPLLLASWSSAQQAQTGQAAAKTTGAATMQGCLSSSSGQYYLTDSSGVKHQLSGNDNKLKAQVGHEVEITGKPSVKTEASTSYGAASSAEEIPVVEVKTVKRLADACQPK
jgi:hypothetical protein